MAKGTKTAEKNKSGFWQSILTSGTTETIIVTVAIAALLIMIVSNSIYGAAAVVALAALGAYLGKLAVTA